VPDGGLAVDEVAVILWVKDGAPDILAAKPFNVCP
jgi:hypothetical protein